MILTNLQEKGLKTAVARYRAKQPYTVIAGYAGTGKSTLIRFIIDALGLDPDNDVVYITYTGKASLVLRNKGCPNAMTAHKLLYYAAKRADGHYVFRPRKYLEYPYKLIVVDEVSMLPDTIWNLLLSHGVPVIACGDPFQLPAITQGTTVLDHPNVFLDEIMRQAKESEIIRVSMDIREGRPLKPGKGKEVNIVSKKDLFPEMYLWGDINICAMNNTRRKINKLMRQMIWDKRRNLSLPLVGDKVICTHNNYDRLNLNEDPLVNGMIGTITHFDKGPKNQYLTYLSSLSVVPEGYDLKDENAEFKSVPVDYQLITTGSTILVPGAGYRNLPKQIRDLEVNPFEYAYAITAHKSQGSSWPKVLVLEEGFPYKKDEHARWLYTACTRPEDKLTLVLED